jgi:hypothetical protein
MQLSVTLSNTLLRTPSLDLSSSYSTILLCQTNMTEVSTMTEVLGTTEVSAMAEASATTKVLATNRI